MTGLDQDMMQKNLSCKSIGDAQKNMFTFSIILVFANIIFLSLGALLYIYANEMAIAIPERTDQLFPTLALNHLPAATGVIFILGLIAAAYSSADSALTALTTSFCVDFLNFEKKDHRTEKELKRTRLMVHVGFSILLLFTILFFNSLDNSAVISKLFVWAGYTYGPILGMFAYGILTRWQLRDIYVLPICIIAPILSYIINANSATLLNGFQFGHMIILLNGIITFLGLRLITDWKAKKIAVFD